MPKVGMEPLRRQQLIDATLKVIDEVGLARTTFALISKEAGMSTGIISHYFGNKKGLIDATVRYLVSQLRVKGVYTDPLQRLMGIVDANFAPIQRSRASGRAWLSFWAQSTQDADLHRLQQINRKRLISNLTYSFRPLIPAEHVKEAAETTAALIDGLWLHCALEPERQELFALHAKRCKVHIQRFLLQFATSNNARER
ncbi:transcriptional regulator BetI [Aestuariibacter sp. A3R04]|uniref:transcriptional regulator BetI n=1 Tax=Aestuariibacter sp. A3R04 TaxID=2841571 RepID=UPI001C086F2E|nr:transcriptional regulator BetI [Aestuariibacter sp. A3R04]MBU3020899.1 transcriptional regulator BetI [Aestuariibacter sp. A3R04]